MPSKLSLRLLFFPIFTLFLYFSSIVSAHAEAFVMCPSLEKIRQSASLISTAEIDNQGTYTAATDNLVFSDNNFLWGMTINRIVAHSTKEAVSNAQALVPKVTIMLSETALHYGIMYACMYFLASSSFDQVVLALGAKQQGEMPVPNYFLR